MNHRLFSIAILSSALPIIAGAQIFLNKGDFVASERIRRDGTTSVSVRLSKSGKAKLKKLNQKSHSREEHVEVNGIPVIEKTRESTL
jgi:hypothetical protein